MKETFDPESQMPADGNSSVAGSGPDRESGEGGRVFSADVVFDIDEETVGSDSGRQERCTDGRPEEQGQNEGHIQSCAIEGTPNAKSTRQTRLTSGVSEESRLDSMRMTYCARVTAEPRGWIIGFRVWVLAGYDDNDVLIAEISENMGNNQLKFNAFAAALQQHGYFLKQQQKEYLLKELLINVCPPTFVGGIRASKRVAKLVAFEQILKVLVHIGPIALIQFTDFVTDLLVIFKFFQDEKEQSAWIGVGFIAASIVISCSMISIASIQWRQKTLSMLLVPLNLHALFLGWVYAEAEAALAAHGSEWARSEGSAESWRKLRDAVRAEEAACKRSDAGSFIRARSDRAEAEKVLGQDGATTQLFEEYQHLHDEKKNLHGVFVVCKAIEAGIESVPLAVLSAAEFFSGALSPSDLAVFGSSLALSVLSMAYGYFSFCDEFHSNAAADDQQMSRTEGRKPALFACYVVNVAWTLTACGMCYAAPVPGAAKLVLLLLPVAFSFFAVGATVLSKAFHTLPRGSCKALIILVINIILIACGTLIFAILAAPIDLIAMRRQATDVRVFYWIVPLFRRLSLLAMVVVALAARFSVFQITVAAVGFVLDLGCSAYLLTVLGPDSQRQTEVGDDTESAGLDPNASESAWLERCRARADEGSGSETGGEVGEVADPTEDLLWAMSLHVQRSVKRARDEKKWGILEVLQGIEERTEALQEQRAALSEAEQAAIRDAIEAYVPSEDVSSEARVLRLLTTLQREQDAPTLPPVPEGEIERAEAGEGRAREEWVHPVHGARLQHALSASVWTSKPSFFGATAEGTAFELSHEVTRCNFFVSHAWLDDGGRKVEMLRNYLFVQNLLGRLLVVSLLLTLFLIPLGIALNAQWESFPIALLPGSVLAVLLVLVLWVVLSSLSLVGARFTPWAFSATTVWIDKLCINQESNETKAAGVKSFPVVLASCDYLVALISKNYFKRLWCVYELAMFARSKTEWLLLFSMDWPSSMSPWKTAELSEQERCMLRAFSFTDADCYVPRDRVTVLNAVRAQFGSVRNFEHYVHHTLPGVLQRSKQRYYSQLMTVGTDALKLAFGG